MDVALNILPVFLVIFLGAGAKQLGFFPDVFVKAANRVVFYIGIPALLFIKLSSAPFHETFDMKLALISSLSVFIVWLLSLVFVRLKIVSPLESASAASFIQTSMHGNIGYIGLAIVFYSLGNNGLRIASFLAAFIMISQVMLSVLSFNIYSGKKRHKIKSIIKILKSIFLNPIVISALVGIIFSFFGLKLPNFLNRFLEIVSSMALPMALLIIGASLSLSLMSKSLYWLFSSSILKLLFLPGLGVMLLHNAGIHLFSIEVAATLLGTPTATVSVIMSSEMEGDVKFASTAVTLSTLLSLFSLCLWSYLIGFLGP
jgi:malate permease and related proteins